MCGLPPAMFVRQKKLNGDGMNINQILWHPNGKTTKERKEKPDIAHLPKIASLFAKSKMISL
jgi:hypothetical protein